MDFKRVYENIDDSYNVLETPYIRDDEDQETCWDFESMKAQIKSWDDEREIEEDDEYLDILEADSLHEWWDAHYDPKGIAFSMSYHSSILDDVKEMIAKHNSKTVHYNHTPLGSIERYDSFADDDKATIIINVEGPLLEEDPEYFEEEVLYCYKGAPLSGGGYDKDSGTFVMVWDRDVLKNLL